MQVKKSSLTYVFQDAGVDDIVTYPHVEKRTSHTLLKEYFGPLNREEINGLYQTFSRDFELLQYDIQWLNISQDS